MIAYFLCAWAFFSPILILARKPAHSKLLKTCLLILPIFIFLCIVYSSNSFLTETKVENHVLQFFYFLIISTTYIGWWEIFWRYYYKQGSNFFSGEYYVSNLIILLSIFPTLIILLFLLGIIPYLLFDQPILLALSVILFRGGAEIFYNVISFLVCFFNSYC